MNQADLENAYNIDPTTSEVIDEAEFFEPKDKVWSRQSPWRTGIVKSTIYDIHAKKDMVYVKWADGKTSLELCDWITKNDLQEQAGAGLKIREPAQLFVKDEIAQWERFAKKPKDVLKQELLVGGGELARRKAGLDLMEFEAFLEKAELLQNPEGHILIKKGSLGILLQNENGQIQAKCLSNNKIITGMAFKELLTEVNYGR